MSTILGFNLHPSLSYAEKDQIVDGDINFVSFKPYKQSYSAGETVDIKLQSTNEFVILDRSYVKFKITPNGDAASTMNSLGGYAPFKDVVDTVSGYQLPILNDWNLFKSFDLNTDSLAKKTINNTLNGFLPEEFSSFSSSTGVPTVNGTTGSIASLTSSLISTSKTSATLKSLTNNVATSFILPCIPTSLSTTTKYVPLCLFPGGYELRWTLANFAEVFKTAGTNATSYTISDLEVVCCMLKPRDDYLMELNNGLAQGAALKLDLELPQRITSSLSSATDQTLKMNVGYKKSINQLIFALRTAAYINANTYDTFACSTVNNLTKYYIQVNEQRYPRNKEITTADAETLVQTLASIGTTNEMFNCGYQKAVAGDRSFFSWNFGSNGASRPGISVNDGIIQTNMTFTADPSTSRFDTFVLYSAQLIFDSNSVRLLV